MSRRFCVLLLILLAGGTRAWAQGGPPLITDDTETPGPGKWEIIVAATSEIRHPDERQYQLPLLDLNYGVGKNIELNYEVPLLLSANRDQAVQAGLGDSLVGIKWRFLEEETAGVAVSAFPQFIFNTPVGSVRRTVIASDRVLFLPVEVQKTIGWLELNFEGGPELHFNAPDAFDAGLVVGRTFGKFEVMGEIHGTTVGGFQQDDLVLEAGCRYEIREGCTLLLSIGRSVYDAKTAPATFLSYTAIQFNF